MPLPISPATQEWKAADAQPIPYASLYEIEVNDTTTLFLVGGDPLGTGQVTYDGHVYLASSITQEDVSQNIEGSLLSFKLGISNIDGVAGGYMEREDLEGRIVKIHEVILFPVGAHLVVTHEWEIQDQSYNRQQAVVTLGTPNLFRIKRPWQTRQRHTCQHNFAERFLDGNMCGYPSDFFGPDKAQGFRAGAGNSEQKRQHGWYTLNALHSSNFDVDIFVPDHLWIYCSSQITSMEWAPGLFNAPFVFKKLSGDWDVWCHVSTYATKLGSLAGIICQSNTGSGDSWVQFGRGLKSDGNDYFRLVIAEGGVLLADNDSANGDPEFLRLQRVGNVFTFYTRDDDAAVWTQLAQKTVAIDTEVRLGLALSAPNTESAAVAATFDFFRFFSGGDPICKQNFEDCSAKGNTVRFGAYRGIPAR